MPRGGKRPGAGAPRGNTNAVKTGRHSVRLRAIAKALSRRSGDTRPAPRGRATPDQRATQSPAPCPACPPGHRLWHP